MITVEEYYNQIQKKAQPVRKECSTCFNMASCWYKHPEDFALDAVKECWEPRKVPSYIKNIPITK